MSVLEEPEEFITVRNADDMNYEIFRKHMNIRHPESLGGLIALPPSLSEYVEECWRTFHDTIHRLSTYYSMNHDHGN